MLSQDCRATIARHSHDIRTSVAKISHGKFAKISRRQVAKYFGEKIRIKFFNMLKTFATTSRLVRDT